MLPISPDLIEGIKRSAFAGDDVFGGLAPHEGLRLGVVLHEVVVDCILKIVDAGVTAFTSARPAVSEVCSLTGRTEGGRDSKLHVLADTKVRPTNMFLAECQTSDYIGARLTCLPVVPR